CARGRNASRAASATTHFPAEHLPHRMRIGRGHGLVLPKAALTFGRLLPQVVALHRVAAEQLAGCGCLEPLLRAAGRFRLRHLSSLLRSSSARAPSPCCGRPATAATPRGRFPARLPPAASASRGPAPDAT